jgi:hypothetical protein
MHWELAMEALEESSLFNESEPKTKTPKSKLDTLTYWNNKSKQYSASTEAVPIQLPTPLNEF